MYIAWITTDESKLGASFASGMTLEECLLIVRKHLPEITERLKARGKLAALVTVTRGEKQKPVHAFQVF